MSDQRPRLATNAERAELLREAGAIADDLAEKDSSVTCSLYDLVADAERKHPSKVFVMIGLLEGLERLCPYDNARMDAHEVMQTLSPIADWLEGKES